MNLVDRYRFSLVAKEQVSTRFKTSKTITRPARIETRFLVKKLENSKLHHGVGANCTILSKFIHPSEHVRTKHANLHKGHKTSVIILGKETAKVQREDQKCCTFRSEDYPNIVLHAVKRCLNVVTEEPPQSFFDQFTGNDATFAEAADEVAPNMPPQMNDHSEDIQAFTTLGAIVDDDNLPAPENIPPPNEPLVQSGSSNEVFPADGWGFQGTCP
jgi:hypothetical protein